MVHRDEAEQMVVRLGHRLGRPMLVHGPHLEFLEVAAIRMRAGGLARSLVGVDFGHLISWFPVWGTRENAIYVPYGNWECAEREARGPTAKDAGTDAQRRCARFRGRRLTVIRGRDTCVPIAGRCIYEDLINASY